MNIENTIKKLKERLLTIKDKNIFYDDFKMIEECKKFILDEISNYTSKNIEKTKEDVFTKIFNFFQLEKYFKKDKIISFKIIFYLFLSIALLVLDFILINIFSLFIGIIALILIIALFFKFINSIKKETEILRGVRINFIIYETLNELKEEFENEEREQFLRPAINVQLEEEELNELLSEDYFEEEFTKPDIKTEIYDRKASLERRKRRKNLKTK